MKKVILFTLFSICLFNFPIEAQWLCWGQKYCWGCRRYMDPTYAEYEALPYGYEDNINYPDRYDLPLNYYFNNRPTSKREVYNYRYFLNCYRNSRR